MAKEKYPEGHFVNQGMGYGIAIGAGLGVALGAAIGNPAFFGVGLPIGIAIGAAMGGSKEKEARDKGLIRQLNHAEKKLKQTKMVIALAVLLLGLIVLALFLR